MERKDEIIRIFAREIRQILQRAEADFDRVQEIRLRVGAPLLIVYKNREYYVSRSEIGRASCRERVCMFV